MVKEAKPLPRKATRDFMAARIHKSVAFVAANIMQQKPIQRGLAVGLSKRGFAISWGIVLFFHLFNAFYTLGLAYIYVFFRKPSMEYWVSIIQMMPQSTYIYITVLYGAISLLNFSNAFSMIVYSIIYRQLVFKKRSIKVADVVDTPQKSRRFCICVPRRVTRFLSRFQRATSVQGHLFDAKLIFRELTEVASQTYQAHSSSFLVSKVWINQLFGAIVFFNCIANTAVHIFKEDEIGMRRFLSTVIDLFLDFAWGFIFPGNIIFHYLPLFVNNQYNVPVEYLSSDTLMVKSILDCRQFFMVSWTDAFTTALPYLSMLTGLRNMKTLLELEEPDDREIRSKTASVTPLTDKDEAKASDLAGSRGPSSADIPKILEPKKKSLCGRLRFMLIIPLFGLCVLFASIQASGAFGNDKCGSGCKLRMRPWFTTECACSVMEINCFERGIEGNETELRAIFQHLDHRVLNSLIVSHCPAVTMPTEFQRFGNLVGLEFYNVSFVDWPRDAAMTEAAFPSLNYLYIARSYVGAWPEGLIHHTTPTLADIEISASVIDPVPDDLDEKWPDVVMLYIDFCGLQEFPTVLTRMAVTDLSLVGNNISVIPEDLPKASSWMYVFLDRNPLQRLPDRVEGIPHLHYFTIQDTNISSLPQWLYNIHDSNPDLHVSANLTRLCATIQSAAVQREEDSFIRCKKINTNTANGGFPLLEKDAVRLITEDAPLPAFPQFY